MRSTKFSGLSALMAAQLTAPEPQPATPANRVDRRYMCLRHESRIFGAPEYLCCVTDFFSAAAGEIGFLTTGERIALLLLTHVVLRDDATGERVSAKLTNESWLGSRRIFNQSFGYSLCSYHLAKLTK